MAIGFLPPSNNRQAVYGGGSQKLGYIEQGGRTTWFQDISGKRIARVLRWKQEQAEICTTLSAGTFPPQGWMDEE